jgi:ABC-2 type transport system permease protein
MAVGRACVPVPRPRASSGRWLCESVGGSASATPPGLDGVGSVTYGMGLTLLGLCYAAHQASRRPDLNVCARRPRPRRRGNLDRLPRPGSRRRAGQRARLGLALRVGSAGGAFGAERGWPALLLWAVTAALLGLGCLALCAPRIRGRGAADPPWPAARVVLPRHGGGVGPAPSGRPADRWAIGLAALGLLYGAVVPTIPDLVASNPDIARAIGASADAEQALIDAFLRYIFLSMAVISTGFAVTSVLRLRSEEE